MCAGPWYSSDVPQAAAEAASAALDRPGVELAPRAQWPTGADRLGVDVKGKIAPADQIEPGRAVARLTDLGLGQRLRALLDGPDTPAPDELRSWNISYAC